MPQVTDLGLVRSILETDRPWSAYALADLEPASAVHSTWFVAPGDRPALALLYRAFRTPVLIAVGQPANLACVLDEVDLALGDAPDLYGVVRPDVLPLLAERYHTPEPRHMLRMLLNTQQFRALDADDVVQLGPGDLASVERLFADGVQAGESPEFFIPSMLEDGVYRGVHEASDLIALGGTHVIAPTVSVAAIGNIYTRRSHRRRGLGARVTSAVTSRLIQMSLQTIVLNVRQSNAAAARIYEALGFERYCDYYEVPAIRRGTFCCTRL
jgi:ribosomal protein S18 acetylase RimI-like enzyme